MNTHPVQATDSGKVELEHTPMQRRATVKQLLDEPETSAATFVARWGKGALLQLPEPELIERALLQFGARATVPSQRPSSMCCARRTNWRRSGWRGCDPRP